MKSVIYASVRPNKTLTSTTARI